MVELRYVDLSTMAHRVGTVVQLSSANDARWAALQFVTPFATLDLAVDLRHDVYLIEGELLEGDRKHATSSFLRRSGASALVAGPAGAIAFVYRDKFAPASAQLTRASHELVWAAGGTHGMTVATLATWPHQLALVSWRPGARVGFHAHPMGEEILVLRGELRDERGAYPAGSWLRFHPGSGHAPYVDQETLILLRNGHLINGEA